jgi:orotate phosphoribosyltransferase
LRPSFKREKTLSKSASRARLAEIIRKRSFGRGEITLASGRKSDFYFNLKPTMLDPEGAALLAELTYEALKDDGLDYVGGLEMGAVPLAGAIAQLSWIKGHPIAAFFVRKKPKEHGARLAVEGLASGETLQGKRVVIVEDVTTTGGSALKAAGSRTREISRCAPDNFSPATLAPRMALAGLAALNGLSRYHRPMMTPITFGADRYFSSICARAAARCSGVSKPRFSASIIQQ